MRVWFAAVIVAASVGTAFAHGEKPHGSKGIDYSKAEQTPFGSAADPKKAPPGEQGVMGWQFT